MLEATDRVISFKLTEDQWNKVDTELQEGASLIRHAYNVFDLLAFVFSEKRIMVDEAGVSSLFELCRRAFKSASENEAEAIAMVDNLIRKGMMKS